MVIVRIPKGDELSLSTALDAGAAGIVIPHCESAHEVKTIMKESFFGMQNSLLMDYGTDRFSSLRPSLIQPLDLHTRSHNVTVPG